MDRVREKVKKRLMSKLLYEKAYTPQGYYDDVETYFSQPVSRGDEYKVIYPSYRQDDEYKRVFGESLSPFVDQDMYRDGHRTVIVSLQDARIDTDKGPSIAVITKNEHLLGEVSMAFVVPGVGRPAYHGKAHENNIFHRRYLTKPYRAKGTVFSMLSGGGANYNFYHWMIDVLPRLHVLKQSGWFDEVDYFLVPNYGLGFQRETLSLMGIEKDRIIDGMKHPHVYADRLIVSSHHRTPTYFVPTWVVPFLRKEIIPALTQQNVPQREYARYVYISRRDSNRRQILNEAEVEGVLGKYGFETYLMSELSFAEKLQLMDQAEVVITPNGAGITNLIFSPSPLHLIEIFPHAFVVPYFYELIRRYEISYDFLVGAPIAKPVADDRLNGIYEDVLIDLDQLRQKLDLCFQLQ